MNKFLHSHPTTEKDKDIGVDHVIVDKKDWETVLSAIAFKKIQIVNDQIFSVPNFLFNMGDSIKVKGKAPVYEIIGRLEWKRYENDYVLKNIKSKEIIRKAESELVPYKP